VPTTAATAGANVAALRGAWCGSAATSDPAARATWGLYRGADGVVFQRENY
jgi:MSHA biogenesis protein MshQ